MTQRNRKLDAVVDTPLSEQDGVSREDQTRVISLAELSSARVNSLLGTIGRREPATVQEVQQNEMSKGFCATNTAQSSNVLVEIMNLISSMFSDHSFNHKKENEMNQLIMRALFAVLISSAGVAFAECCICFDGTADQEGDCFVCEGSCEDFFPGGLYPEAHCYPAAKYNKATDYLFAEKDNGKAWLIVGKKRTPVLPDAVASFAKDMITKYPKNKRKDQKIAKQIKAEFDAFRKKNKDFNVSKERLTLLAKETSLLILDKEPKK